MQFNIGDYVTRNSHNNDIIFKIINFDYNKVFLKGADLRLCADANIEDLSKADYKNDNDINIINRNIKSLRMDRSEYFYLPGKILHIDGDNEYLERCMNFYKNLNIKANGLSLLENDIPDKIEYLLNEYRPDIVVITGHDAYYSKKNSPNNIDNYQNSKIFSLSVKNARKYEKSQDKLIIIAGACQSDYEELIKSGANFASSPKRINIHALDPAIIASSIALSDKNTNIDLIGLIDKTKFGKDGYGGIITNGTMYMGYPR